MLEALLLVSAPLGDSTTVAAVIAALGIGVFAFLTKWYEDRKARDIKAEFNREMDLLRERMNEVKVSIEKTEHTLGNLIGGLATKADSHSQQLTVISTDLASIKTDVLYFRETRADVSWMKDKLARLDSIENMVRSLLEAKRAGGS